MPHIRFLVGGAATGVVLVAALACGGGAPSLADQECALPADANPCETCLTETCGQVCRDCVNDEKCYACTDRDDPPEDCFDNPQVAALVTCVLDSCTAECEESPSRRPRDRVGRGRKGGKGRGKGRRRGD